MITIVSSENCPYCDMAKNLLSSLWYEYKTIDITNDGDKLREIVWTTWMMTVPQIFSWEVSKENLLWGFSEINALNNEWKLKEILD
jgi:glutaredoxin